MEQHHLLRPLAQLLSVEVEAQKARVVLLMVMTVALVEVQV